MDRLCGNHINIFLRYETGSPRVIVLVTHIFIPVTLRVKEYTSFVEADRIKYIYS